ncbi:MAG: 50S ribosomal protein L6 [Betaproteobacteria bacterium]|jgi:large subunit ribosomal protein L6|uniref:Large ribosomal subunit protein uL6 n=1 Tax=Thiomonas delicata TaxID=364030 RepID=A0A238CZS9_THIDL|nr:MULTISPECIES: 50S ribosomal protein L6 [Thiomonas]MDE2130089.1 50S ribosomal protein L6 [Betaproteobacteria bacterium]OZB45067.1 MAG: 50S ribosomal protein L6 [Thiomonas sp. 15-66-11]OZB47644.1 MAG: 50S ribosomal protein L6 [Thiomonas sp. 14-66-4]SBP86508.1 50S ribosomal subunit protein L6 [Thiomonas delicata]
MSRVAKNPIVVPKGVEVSLTQEQIAVKGGLGRLERPLNPLVKVELQSGALTFAPSDASREAHALSGTYRALVAGMVAGVDKGFEKKLTLVGVGYKAQVQGAKLNLSLGFSHPVIRDMPAGIKVETPTQTEIVLKGVDKQLVGQVAADIRAIRPPEPYKGKGVRYANEVVVIKETKKK